MRVLVTGASGYVARWLIPELHGRNYEVWGTDSQSYFGGQLENDRFFAADLRQNDSIGDLMGWAKPDIVVHLAALYGRLQGELRPRTTVDINTAVTAALAKECGDRGIRLAYVSSSEVYGDGPNWDRPTRVIDPCLPLNMYGWSKLWGEKAVEHYCTDALVLRLNMPYGPGLKVTDLGYNALHTFLWQAHHRRPITVHQGTSRTYTWAGDMARGVRMIVESGEVGRFNVCRDDDLWTSEEVAMLACEIAGVTSTEYRQLVTLTPPPPDVTPFKTFDNRRLLALGWEPTVQFHEGARATHEWTKTVPKEGWT